MLAETSTSIRGLSSNFTRSRPVKIFGPKFHFDLTKWAGLNALSGQKRLFCVQNKGKYQPQQDLWRFCRSQKTFAP